MEHQSSGPAFHRAEDTDNVTALVVQEGDTTCLNRLVDAIVPVSSEYRYFFNIIEP